MMLRIQLERQAGGFFPTVREYCRLLRAHRRAAASARSQDVPRHAPGADEPRASRSRARSPTARIGDPRAGDERRGGAHGGALPAVGGSAEAVSRLLIRDGRVVDPSQRLDAGARRPDRGRQGRARSAERIERREARGDRRDRARGLPRLHRHPRPPARARARVQGDDRDRDARRRRGRLHRRLLHAQHAARSTTRAAVTRVHPASGARATARCAVYPIGAVTKGLQGEELAEMGDMARGRRRRVLRRRQAGRHACLMRRALEYARDLRPRRSSTTARTRRSPPRASCTRARWRRGSACAACPRAAEDVMVARDILLAELTGGQVHIAHVSHGGVGRRRCARRRRAACAVTCEVTPHHLVLTDEAVGETATTPTPR